MAQARTAVLFDLDGTLVDSVYEHVLAWRRALEATGIELAVWRIHRRIGMSGGLLVNALYYGSPGASSLPPILPICNDYMRRRTSSRRNMCAPFPGRGNFSPD